MGKTLPRLKRLDSLRATSKNLIMGSRAQTLSCDKGGGCCSRLEERESNWHGLLVFFVKDCLMPCALGGRLLMSSKAWSWSVMGSLYQYAMRRLIKSLLLGQCGAALPLKRLECGSVLASNVALPAERLS